MTGRFLSRAAGKAHRDASVIHTCDTKIMALLEKGIEISLQLGHDSSGRRDLQSRHLEAAERVAAEPDQRP
jgi:hypothetical protein